MPVTAGPGGPSADGVLDRLLMARRGGGKGKGKILRIALDFLKKPRKRKGRSGSALSRRKVKPLGPDVPAGVRRLPSGRLPANYRYAGKVYDGKQWTPKLQKKYPNGVRFTKDGFPDFGPYVHKDPARRRYEVKFDPRFTGDHKFDESKALERLKLDRTPDGYTWHHHQDAQTLQLVPKDVHKAVRHAGGVAIVKGR